MEVLKRDPLIVLDGAHNEAGARVLGAALAETFAANKRHIIVLGLLKGREPSEIISALMASGEIALIVAVAPPTQRALDPELITAAARNLGIDAVTAPSVARAIELAEDAADDHSLIAITGSLYLVADARARLQR